jgi:ubiquinol-cytochrome c reductase cytochrome b subunit
MNVLLVLHLLQVVIDGAYRAPREINFWFGFFLLQIVLALSLTGYLLPWDQKGFWATKVTTNIMGIVPFAGPILQRLIIGGAEYGHHTLTRFFALHAGVLPATVILLVFWHIYLFRRHGITAKDPKRNPDEKFWPDQVLKDVSPAWPLVGRMFLIWSEAVFIGAEMGRNWLLPLMHRSVIQRPPGWSLTLLFQFLVFSMIGNLSELWLLRHRDGDLVSDAVFGALEAGAPLQFVLLVFALLGIGLLTHWRRQGPARRDYRRARG